MAGVLRNGLEGGSHLGIPYAGEEPKASQVDAHDRDIRSVQRPRGIEHRAVAPQCQRHIDLPAEAVYGNMFCPENPGHISIFCIQCKIILLSHPPKLFQNLRGSPTLGIYDDANPFHGSSIDGLQTLSKNTTYGFLKGSAGSDEPIDNESDTMNDQQRILLTGATGYVGGKLLRRLERDGYVVNCLVRRPEKLTHTGNRTKVFKGDLLDGSLPEEAFKGIECAFYLVHSMDGSTDFGARECEAADRFVSAACRAGVKRIVYLGGLGNEQDGLSEHLRSRQAVGRILRCSGIPTIELRASIVLGAGSISFEMIRSLTEHLPFMVMPKWVSSDAQPIYIDDLLEYLVESVELQLDGSMIVEIGGADQVSYRELMKEYSRQRNLHRIMMKVPLLTPWLSSHWLGLVTPLYANVGRHLIEGVRNRTVVENPENAARYQVRPRGMREAIAMALRQERQDFLDNRWLRNLSVMMPESGHRILHHHHLLIDYRCSVTEAPPHRLYEVLAAFGGRGGMYAWNGLWRLRSLIDRCLGGRPAITRAAANGDSLHEGKAIRFFHVELLDRNRRIRLKTDMKLPGEAWLEFGIDQTGSGTRLHHVVLYEPRGLLGLLYWYLSYPVHAIVFRGMHLAILREACKQGDTAQLTDPVLIHR